MLLILFSKFVSFCLISFLNFLNSKFLGTIQIRIGRKMINRFEFFMIKSWLLRSEPGKWLPCLLTDKSSAVSGLARRQINVKSRMPAIENSE